MSENEEVDTETELKELLKVLQPQLQDVIKRSFTNIAMQTFKNGEHIVMDSIEDISYSAKHTQVNLVQLELTKQLSFHIQNIALDLNCMKLALRCSLGEVCLRGLYSAYNENLYNLLPVMAEGHVVIKLSEVHTDLEVGLEVENDALSFINPYVEVTHDEIVVQLSWPSPKANKEYEFVTTEQIAKHMDDLPITIALNQPLSTLLRRKLLAHLRTVMKSIPLLSDLFSCEDTIVELYSDKVSSLSAIGNKVIDVLLINVRRTLFQSQREVLELPRMIATFLQKIGSLSFVGRLETDTGWVKNLATVNRTSEVSVRPGNRTCSFHTTLRIKDLKIGFDEYRIKLPSGTGPTGRILVTVGDNSLHLAITTGVTDWQSYSQLDDLRIEFFDKLDLHITGLGGLSWISSKATAWINGYLNAVVSQLIERQLKAEIHRTFTEICLWDIVEGKN